LVQQVLQLAEEGLGLKAAVAEIAAANSASKSELYSLALEARKTEPR
jgi:hypothetical protein